MVGLKKYLTNDRDHAESTDPCENLCITDGKYCINCYRTKDKQYRWYDFSNWRRERILVQLKKDRNNMINWIKKLFKKKPSAKDMQNSSEPWVNVIKANLDPNNPKQGFFELEWNPAFVKHLIAHGYYGPTAEDIVDQWFTELCRNISMDQIADSSFIADAARVTTNQKTKHQL